ncbi:MAG: hypothetical protein P9L92_17495, partial [Candidatus Electryonea clarkiae]|nr:hypothetical protein [Candidatus Electryonea clarkiae]MDP8286762.1 hypothetical protein [Candidatus Electryonea clarkiae]
LQYSTPKVIIGAIAAGMQIVQKIWTIRIEKLDEKGTREISGLASLFFIFMGRIHQKLIRSQHGDVGHAVIVKTNCWGFLSRQLHLQDGTFTKDQYLARMLGLGFVNYPFLNWMLTQSKTTISTL